MRECVSMCDMMRKYVSMSNAGTETGAGLGVGGGGVGFACVNLLAGACVCMMSVFACVILSK